VVARLAHDGRIVAFDIGGEFHSADPTLDGLHVDLLKMKELPDDCYVLCVMLMRSFDLSFGPRACSRCATHF